MDMCLLDWIIHQFQLNIVNDASEIQHIQISTRSAKWLWQVFVHNKQVRNFSYLRKNLWFFERDDFFKRKWFYKKEVFWKNNMFWSLQIWKNSSFINLVNYMEIVCLENTRNYLFKLMDLKLIWFETEIWFWKMVFIRFFCINRNVLNFSSNKFNLGLTGLKISPNQWTGKN